MSHPRNSFEGYFLLIWPSKEFQCRQCRHCAVYSVINKDGKGNFELHAGWANHRNTPGQGQTCTTPAKAIKAPIIRSKVYPGQMIRALVRRSLMADRAIKAEIHYAFKWIRLNGSLGNGHCKRKIEYQNSCFDKVKLPFKTLDLFNFIQLFPIVKHSQAPLVFVAFFQTKFLQKRVVTS